MKTKMPGVTTPLNQPRHTRAEVFICQNGYYKKILYADILYVKAEGSYSCFYLKDKSRLMISYNLLAVERTLTDSRFARVQQSFILNLDHVDTIAGNSLKIGDQSFTIGRDYREKVLSLFNILDSSRKKEESTL